MVECSVGMFPPNISVIESRRFSRCRAQFSTAIVCKPFGISVAMSVKRGRWNVAGSSESEWRFRVCHKLRIALILRMNYLA